MFQINYLSNRTCHYFKILKKIYDLFYMKFAAISFSLYKKKKKNSKWMYASDLPPSPSRFWIKKPTWNIIDLQKENTHIDISLSHTQEQETSSE